MISLKNVQKQYQSEVVLNINHLQLNNGDIIGLIGPNGAGKTTLAEIILGTKDQSQGEIIYQPTFKTLRRNAVFQESAFDDQINLSQIAKFFSEIYGVEFNPEQLFATFGLTKRVKTRYRKLSGGEKQRFKLMIALLNQPNLVLFDEIANSLDYQTKKWVIDYIKNYDVTNKIVIVISHDPTEIKMLCNRIIKLVNGQIVEDLIFKDKKVSVKRIEELMSYEKSL